MPDQHPTTQESAEPELASHGYRWQWQFGFLPGCVPFFLRPLPACSHFPELCLVTNMFCLQAFNLISIYWMLNSRIKRKMNSDVRCESKESNSLLAAHSQNDTLMLSSWTLSPREKERQEGIRGTLLWCKGNRARQ